MNPLVDTIVAALAAVLENPANFVPLHIPEFSGNEKAYLADCIDSNFVSSVGAYVDRFEEMLAEFTGVKKAIVTVNGTAALHACLHLAGVEPGDEVMVPTFTFIATANAVWYCGATSHFVDVSEETLGLDPFRLRTYLEEIAQVQGGVCRNRKTGARIRAVVPMHSFGHPVDLDPLVQLCEEFQLVLIEDAAESLGSYYKGVHTGSFGACAALSFNGNKIITTGGGGAILTNDEELGRLAKHVTTTAKVPHRWEFNHDRVGFNYRMPALNAALGCAQLEQVPGFLARKRVLAAKYQEQFAGINGVRFFTEPGFATSNYWLNALVLEEERAELRDCLLEQTNERGLMTRPAWTLMHRLPMFSKNPRMDLFVAESLERRLVNIPSSAYLAGA
ncbi:perosamine synthetase [Geomonas limicola]|uniref:GDP-perosamine synthase n=1 Tax=Geomonas limicola TaxID=2740186 RepID=A0A6V8NDM8_9BACT|nr:LegC family aminotransferase [Geomonas limicola]GFO69229.1 perosamine synthetase [Geomonas limicola]